ncbi:MAG: HD-GYP domain-containing protein [Lachnospiraceae bacterium]|nr:HD-GYP domain-containing protein [Lachnospiraceae bacterium]
MANEDWVDENGESVALDDLEPGPHLLSKNLDEISAGGKAICFTSIDTEFTLYADDEPIYDYHPSVPLRFGRSYGMYVHTVAIPDSTGKISIQVEPVFTSGSADFDRIMIADSGWYMLEHFKRNMFSFGMSTATLMLGAFFLVIGLTNAIMMRSAGIDFISFGITCMLIGFIGYNDTLMLQLLTGHPEIIRVVTYVCLIFLPFPALSFFAGSTGYGQSRMVSGMLLICLVDFAAQVLLTHKGFTDYYYLVKVSHIIIIVSISMAGWFVFKAVRKGMIRTELLRSITWGLAACAAGAMIDLVRFHFFHSRGSSWFTRLGVFVFTIVIGIFLIQEQTQALKRKHMEGQMLVSEITEALAKMIDMKDTYTNGHSARVAKYTAMLSKELGYDDDTLEKFYRIALLHDVGKIGIPGSVLNKPGKLTDEEYALIKSHTTMGYEALKDISIMPELAIGAQAHHERPDGKGYPNGLSASEIPRVAQIIAVADCFDAMYSDRPYRKQMEFDKAVSIIKDVSGTQLTPDVVEAF